MKISKVLLLLFVYLFINFENSLFSKIYLTNNTNGALQISWLTSRGKSISSSDSILTAQINRQYTVPKNAAKFKVIWGGGSIISDTINIIQNNHYQATCLPDNYSCNQIILKNIGLQNSIKNNVKQQAKASSDSTNALNIYLVNTTKSELQINWLDSTGKILSNSVVANNQRQQTIDIIPNAASFTISHKGNIAPSNSTALKAEEVYKISCQIINNKCAQPIVTDSGSVNTFKVTRSANSPLTTSNLSTTKLAKSSSGISRASESVSKGMSGGASRFGGSPLSEGGFWNSFSASPSNTMLPDYTSNRSGSSAALSSRYRDAFAGAPSSYESSSGSGDSSGESSGGDGSGN